MQQNQDTQTLIEMCANTSQITTRANLVQSYEL